MTDITKNPEKNPYYLNNVDSQQNEELYFRTISYHQKIIC